VEGKPPSLRWHLFGTLAVVIVLLAACVFSGGAIAQEVVDRSDYYTILLWLDEDLLQRSDVGRHYRNLFWINSDSVREVTEGFSPAELAESFRVLDLWMPNLRKLRNGEGGSARITAEQMDAVIAILNLYAERGDIYLRADIRREMERLHLGQFTGLSMTEARIRLHAIWGKAAPPVP
jgi:hypothetical protein